MAVSRNGCFQLIHNGDQSSLKIYPPKGEGKRVPMELITRYFNYIKLYEYNVKLIKNAIDLCKEPVEVKISDKPICPHNELMFVSLDDSKINATCMFIPPSSKGRLLSKEEIVSTIANIGVKYGIREDVIDQFIKSRVYCTNIVMARGIPVVEGKSAVIKYNFSTKLESKPKLLEDGSVDFQNLDIINHVEQGDILAYMEPMVEGKPGKNLMGEIVFPKKVRNAVMKHGKDIYLSEDGLTMYSDVSGHVGLAGDRVFVSDVYEVPADVGVASGNVEYNGSVHVKGNVITGYSVKADGDIIVDGVVEGATLIAGGQIYLKRGIQGMGKGLLIAGDNIVSKFMENCTAKSGQDILADAIMHSNVTATGSITVTGRKGLITGGKIKASKDICALNIGSSMGTKTECIIAVNDEMMAEYRELEALMARLKEEQEKNIQIVALCKEKMKTGKASEELIKAAQIAQFHAQKLQSENEENVERYRFLKKELLAYKPGKVEVKNTAYQGVELKMGSEIYRLKSEVIHSKFVLEGAEVKIRMLM